MNELGRAERPESVRHQLAFAIAVHGADGGADRGGWGPPVHHNLAKERRDGGEGVG